MTFPYEKEELQKQATQKNLDLLTLAREDLRRTTILIEKTIAEEIPEEIQSRINLIKDRYSSILEEAQYNIAKLEKEIKEETLVIEETINGATLQAVYAKGKVSWDDKGLTGFAVAYPKILSFKKQGEPYITIKAIKK